MKLVGNTYLPDSDEFFVNYFKLGDVFERKSLDIAIEHVKKWDVAVDGGAHVGSWSRFLCDKFNLVASFEPNPDNFECLVANTRTKNNIILSKFGLYDSYQEFALESGNNTGCWHLSEGKGIKVMPMPDFGALDFLKLDVEGFEHNAIAGMIDQIKRYRPVIVIEEKNLPHKVLQYEARNILESIGYKEVGQAHKDIIFA